MVHGSWVQIVQLDPVECRIGTDRDQQELHPLLMRNIMKERLKRLFDNAYSRQDWVRERLQEIPENSIILDAGCGDQKYRRYCRHLEYYAQDFGAYVTDEKDSLTAGKTPYEYGPLDYMGNVWKIEERDGCFDVILCTEVLEHVPYPNRAITEFHRLLRPGGLLILTVPANSLRHMDPYYFYSGFSDRYLTQILTLNRFRDIRIEPVGSYHAWLMVETARCLRHEGPFAWGMLWPALFYHYLKQRSPSENEINALCFGYHVTAAKEDIERQK